MERELSTPHPGHAFESFRPRQREGLVVRQVHPEVPVRVEYSLTPLGWSLTSPLMALYEWAAAELRDSEPWPRSAR